MRAILYLLPNQTYCDSVFVYKDQLFIFIFFCIQLCVTCYRQLKSGHTFLLFSDLSKADQSNSSRHSTIQTSSYHSCQLIRCTYTIESQNPSPKVSASLMVATWHFNPHVWYLCTIVVCTNWYSNGFICTIKLWHQIRDVLIRNSICFS